ncbi:hypothetical protein HJC22_32435 [Corallococcus exiguus]|uniref:hypothetical protein n=1 Tax=Corallococcus exiguus TaxID=83462 RepID=UPI001471237E|nr:hypothetical protein [Corallococcus exiguus]NNC20436.1 hypothetical protein [Corallococcus exiguus]NPD22157.1 hypothetical protein [Corallococcus exiguus]
MLEDLVELLDRQWKFLHAQEGTAFYRQLRRFVRFVQEDPRLAALLRDIQRDASELTHRHFQHDQSLTQSLVALKGEFVKQAPDEDDSSTPPPADGWLTPAHELTLARFDAIANYPHARPIKIDTLADDTKSRKLLEILAAKINNPERRPSLFSHPTSTTRTKIQQSKIDELQIQLINLQQQQEYAHRKFVDEKLTSSGLLLNGVLQLLHDLNPEPTPLSADEEERDAQMRAQVNQWFNEGLEMPGKRKITEALYNDHTSSKDKNDALEHSVQALKLYIERIYEDLRLRVGTRRSLLGLINRFQHRCQWHDRVRLFNLAKGAKRKVEETLTAELALWLFDQGLSPVSKPMMAGLQPDLTDPSFKFNLYIEAKQYNASAKDYLVHGFHQLWDTVSGLKGTPYEVKEAFYVVFRCGGPRYVLPDQALPGEGWTAHLRIIDIAPAKERGSQGAKKPIVISMDELMPARP